MAGIHQRTTTMTHRIRPFTRLRPTLPARLDDEYYCWQNLVRVTPGLQQPPKRVSLKPLPEVVSSRAKHSAALCGLINRYLIAPPAPNSLLYEHNRRHTHRWHNNTPPPTILPDVIVKPGAASEVALSSRSSVHEAAVAVNAPIATGQLIQESPK